MTGIPEKAEVLPIKNSSDVVFVRQRVRVWAIGLKLGRTRSARCLIVVVISALPSMTTTRNGTIQSLRVRTVSTIASTTAST